MPEATIIILDNSNYSINGDYHPTRWLSQIDAAGLLIQTKMEQNHETAMGLALSGGNQVEIICTPTTDISKVTSYLYGIKQFGHQKLANALQTAALALKHRANPNLAQRIICFVASTITEHIEDLKIICKKMKKNNISLDLIGIGDLSAQQRQKMEAMNAAVKSQTQNCSLMFVEPEGNVSDVLFTSQMLGGQANAPQMMLNEADDPELRMALELSLQDEQMRLAALAANQQANQRPAEEEDLEQRALQLSMEQQKKAEKKDQKKD